MDVFAQLIALANSLDSRGLYEEADMLDEALHVYAQQPMSAMEKMRWEAAQRRKNQNPYAPGQQPTGVQQQQQAVPPAPVPQAQPQQGQQPSAADLQRAQQYAQQDQREIQQARQKGKQERDQMRAQQQAGQYQGGRDQPQTGLAQQPTQKQPLKPQPGQQQPKQQAGKQKRKMNPRARQQWKQQYQRLATVMGLSNANPKAVFREVQRRYPGLYQKGMNVRQLYNAVSQKELTGQTSGPRPA